MRFLGLDYGDKRIGVALSDGLGWTAEGFLVLERKNPSDHKVCISKLIDIVREHTISVIVLGYPRNMDGSEGENCKKVKAFADKLAKALPDVEIDFFDERLSSSSARQIFHMQGTNPKKRGAGSLDKKAAEIILQGYLDAQRHTNKKEEKKKMTNESVFDMDDIEMEFLTVTDDEGNELEYIILDEFAHKGSNFLVMMKAEDIEDEESEAVIFKQIPTDDEEEFAFEEITEEEYNEIEEMLKARLEEFGIDLE